MKKDKFKIQENEYKTPYHHLVSFEKDYKQYESLGWGLEYYSYVNCVLNYIKKSKVKQIVEVGCGDGKILLELAKQNPNKNFTGFDLSKKAIAFARAFSLGMKNLNFYDKDFSRNKKKYDLILCLEVLEHIPDKEVKKFIKILYDNLSKNGKLIFSVPTTNRKLISKHHRHYDLKLLKEQLNDFFRIEENFYLHKQNLFYKIIKNFLENPFFICKGKTGINFMKNLYIKLCKNANSENGSHLITICKKSKNLLKNETPK